jgi:hypothetical protein
MNDGGSILGRAGNFVCATGSGARQASFSVAVGSSFPGVKAAGT